MSLLENAAIWFLFIIDALIILLAFILLAILAIKNERMGK